MSQMKGPLTSCGYRRWGTQRWANLEQVCHKRRATHSLWTFKIGNTAVSKLGTGKSQRKGPLTRCRDWELEHGGEQECHKRRGYSLAAEIEDGEHGGEQTWNGDVTKEGATDTLRRLKMGDTAVVSKLGSGMSQKKVLLTCCGDWRWGTQRWANLEWGCHKKSHTLPAEIEDGGEETLVKI